MAAFFTAFSAKTRGPLSCLRPSVTTAYRCSTRRIISHASLSGTKVGVPDFAFAFDIDGVLLRSSEALTRAPETLQFLQRQRIPFILLTNGGGTHETARVAELMNVLGVALDTSIFVQSHTPFADLVHGDTQSPALKNRCILVTGGNQDNCRKVAEDYGFTNVISPADIIAAYPDLMPFARSSSYATFSRPLPRPPHKPGSPVKNPLKIDAIFIFNDPRDWALDMQLILDLLLSHAGILGTLSPLNGNTSLPNRGYQQDGQPPLYFSNPDLFWAAKYHLPRLGQGGFREALEGVWRAVTGGEENGVTLQKRMYGKPYRETYAFAERRLLSHRNDLARRSGINDDLKLLKRVYMVGDNPASDILGANQYSSSHGASWHSILVRSGVFSGDEPEHQPNAIVDDVWDAVQWALKNSGWREQAQV